MRYLISLLFLVGCGTIKTENKVDGGTANTVTGETIHRFVIEIAVPDIMSNAFKNECTTPGATQQEIDKCIGTKTSEYMQQILALIANFQQNGQINPLTTK